MRMWSKALLGLAAVLMAGSLRAAERPNIVLIVVESLRRDTVGCYGYHRATTPAMDRLAAEGVRFDEAVAVSSWTVPCMASLITATPPAVHGITNWHQSLGEGFTTLAAELKKGGYQTAGINANPMLLGKLGFGRGFDFYDDYTIRLAVDLELEGAKRADSFQTRPTNEDVTRLALTWLNRQRKGGTPFFLHLFYFDPHYDYRPPPPYDRMFTDPDYHGKQDGRRIYDQRRAAMSATDKTQLMALYDGEVRFTDDHIRKVIDELRKLGVWEDTLVVVTADHGEEFWEHGGMTHDTTLYEEVVRVPLVMRYPGKIKAGTVVKGPVSQTDILPTLLDLAGLPIPKQCLGRSRASSLATGKAVENRPFFLEAEIDGVVKAARTSAQKVVVRKAADGQWVRELYALAEDPQEQRDLNGTVRAGEFADLDRQFSEWQELSRKQAGTNAVPKEVELDADQLRRLRSLGYLQ